jgi:hypothetical protein
MARYTDLMVKHLGIPIHRGTHTAGCTEIPRHLLPSLDSISAMEKHTNQTFHIFDARDFTQPFVLLSRL